MFVILLENSNNTVLSEVDTFTNHYPRSSIKRITRYTTLKELHSLANKPLLSIGWLIICQDTAIKNSSRTTPPACCRSGACWKPLRSAAGR